MLQGLRLLRAVHQGAKRKCRVSSFLLDAGKKTGRHPSCPMDLCASEAASLSSPVSSPLMPNTPGRFPGAKAFLPCVCQGRIRQSERAVTQCDARHASHVAGPWTIPNPGFVSFSFSCSLLGDGQLPCVSSPSSAMPMWLLTWSRLVGVMFGYPCFIVLRVLDGAQHGSWPRVFNEGERGDDLRPRVARSAVGWANSGTMNVADVARPRRRSYGVGFFFHVSCVDTVGRASVWTHVRLGSVPRPPRTCDHGEIPRGVTRVGGADLSGRIFIPSLCSF